MKKLKIKRSYVIVLVLILLLGLVLFVGSYSYTNISRVVKDVEKSTVSEGKLLQTKNLLSEIALAENSVKTFGLTKKTEYLNQYYESINSASDIINNLMENSFGSDQSSTLDLELLDSLITQKFRILNSYLELQNDSRVEIALDKVIKSIDANSEQTPGDETEETKPKVNRFFKKLFQKDNQSHQKNEKVEINHIDEKIQAIKNQENRINKSIVAEEVSLLLEDKTITTEINEIINQFEISENQRVAIRSEKAAKEIHTINQQITLLFVNVGLLVLFVIFLIIRYVKTNNRFGKALEKAKNRAEQLAETKERFLNNMSHEIRTPMNAISGFIKQLSKSSLNADQQEQVDIISKSSDYLLHIIDEVLVYNRLQHKQDEIDKRGFDIYGFIEDLNQIMTPSARKKGIEFLIDVDQTIPKVIVGDPYKLNQILINVVGNAVKFTTHGSINLSVKQLDSSPNMRTLRFTITDTGIGMTDEQLSRIFDEFEQAEVSTTRQFGGTGLGLSITKKIVHLLNGTISVESEKGVGTTFEIDLPFKVGSESDMYVIRGEAKTTTELKNVSILIVDDEIYNRKLLRAVLGKHQVNITEAENGIEAVEEVKRNRYDVVLMDTRMPVMDGIEATKLIRKNEEASISDVPIIAITAAVSEVDQKNYKEAGMNGFLPKPFKESDLIAKIGLVTGQIKIDTTESNETHIKEKGSELDFKHLMDLSNGDTHFFMDMLETFIETLDNGLSCLSKELKNKNLPMIAEHAHRIASPCKHLGAMELYTSLKGIENGIRSSKLSLSDVAAMVETVKQGAKVVRKQVVSKIELEATK